MSRCFPFPPPGYETKVRTGDIDLLAKEKHKEKKHKKDKKDKEKREGKEKKDKDRRKDKKEKRKDKKAKDRDDGTAKKSDERRSEGQPESSNRQKHGPNGLLNVDIKDLKYVQELDRRYRNDERATGSQVVEKIMVTDQRHLLANQSREKDRIKDKKEDVNAQRNHVEGNYSEEAFVHNFPSIDQTRLGGIAKPIEKQREVHRNGERAGSQVVQKIMVSGQKPLLANQSREKERLKDKNEDDRAVNGQRNHVEGNSSAQTFVQNFPIIDHRRLAGIGKPIEKQLEVYRNGEKANGSQVAQKIMASGQRPLPNQFRENERIKDKKADDRTVNGRNHVVGKSSEQAFVQSFPSTDQRRLEAIAKPIEQDVEKQMEGRDRKKSADYDSKDHKSKEKDKEKKVKSKDKDRDNKKEKEKVKEIRKPSAEQPKLEGSGNVSLDAFSNKASDILQMNGKNSATRGNLGKRKELEMNGYLHENGFLPHKVPRSVSSHPVMENGRKPEPSQTVQFLTEGIGPANNCKADVKEHRINSLVGSEQPNACSTKPSSSGVKVYENGGASTKPSHPDSKYLSEILSIPKIEDKLDFDDQEWLFSSNGSESKKPKVGAPEVDKPPQVWAEAMEIESADVYALPYVIPY